MQRVFAAILLFLSLAAAGSSHAAGVVSTCNEASLDAALAGGGSVTFTCSGTITLTGNKTITVNTTIDGTGQSVTLNCGSTCRLFTVNGGVSLAVTALTLANGSSPQGGAIYNSGTINIINSSFTGNGADNGGAIYNLGTATITNSSFSGNQGFSGLGGGAIYLSSGTATITNSTFSGNTAGFGGAITGASPATATITNSTFSGNQAVTRGGAIYGTGLTITSSTFSANNSSSPTGGSTFWVVNLGTINISNSAIFSASGVDCVRAGFLPDGGYNLSRDTSCGFTGTGSQQSVTAQQLSLGALGNNGGPTPTILPGNGSITFNAIPAGTNGCGTTITADQRGIARPQRGNCDIGAVEIPYRVSPRVVSE